MVERSVTFLSNTKILQKGTKKVLSHSI